MGFASQLAEEIHEAAIAEFGEGVFGCPSKYFDQHVTVTAPNGIVAQRSPMYCATQFGAAQFKKDSDPEAGPYTGPKVNAALLLGYFNHGYPARYALNCCQLEVWDAFVQAGLMDSNYDRQAIMAQPEDL